MSLQGADPHQHAGHAARHHARRRHATTSVFDGHGFTVRADSGVTKAAELRGATICLVQGATNEQVTANYLRAIDTPFQPVLFERTD